MTRVVHVNIRSIYLTVHLLREEGTASEKRPRSIYILAPYDDQYTDGDD